MLKRRLEYSKTEGLILRRTLPELERSHILKLFQEQPRLRNFYNDQKKMLSFPNGSTLFFGSAPHEKDMGDYYSAEYADIMVDEAQEFTQGELERLSGSLRCTTNADIVPKMVHTFMPGYSESGIPPKGLPYLKRVYKEKVLRGDETKREWAFVQAFSWDNIEWARQELTRDGIGRGVHKPGRDDCQCQECVFYSWPDDVRREYFLTRTEYGANLLAITDNELREAWLFGKWDVFEGLYFPQFSREKHVKPHAQVLQMLKPWYTYWLGGDWGYDHPHAIYLNAMDENQRVITFGEIWGRKVGETDLGRAVTAKCAGRTFRSFTFSWDAGKLSPRAHAKFPKSIGEMFAEALGANVPKPSPADSSPGSRIARARLASQLFDSNHVIISDECTHLIECLPTLVRDPKNTEDVLKVDFSENSIGDDSYDGWTMGLQHMLGTSKTRDVLLEERLQEVRRGFAAKTDMTGSTADMMAKFGARPL